MYASAQSLDLTRGINAPRPKGQPGGCPISQCCEIALDLAKNSSFLDRKLTPVPISKGLIYRWALGKSRQNGDMIKVAVTGGAGAGKTVVCDCFGQLGAHVINLDALAREAVQPDSAVLDAIVTHFGEGILMADRSLDRGKLRGIITRDAEARKALERLTHPEILRLFEKKIAAIKSRQEDAVVVVEVPLLIEVGMQDRFDVVILVEADSEHQKSRLVTRNGSSVESAAALLGIQMTPEEKRPHADYVVENRGALEELEGPVKEIYAKIIKR